MIKTETPDLFAYKIKCLTNQFLMSYSAQKRAMELSLKIKLTPAPERERAMQNSDWQSTK